MTTQNSQPSLTPEIHREIGRQHFRNFFAVMRTQHGDAAHDRYIEAALIEARNALVEKYGRRPVYTMLANIADDILTPELQ